MIKHPATTLAKISKAVILHGTTIFKDGKNAAGHWKNKEYESFGWDLGDIVKIVFLKRGLDDLDKQDATEIIKEFTIGLATALIKDFSGSLPDCIEGSTEIVQEIINAINELKDAKGNISKLTKALVHVSKAIMKLPGVFKNCPGAVYDIAETLATIAAKFSNPVTAAALIGKAILFHAFRLWHDVSDIYSQFTHPDAKGNIDYKSIGFDFGDIIAVIVFKVPTPEAQ